MKTRHALLLPVCILLPMFLNGCALPNPKVAPMPAAVKTEAVSPGNDAAAIPAQVSGSNPTAGLHEYKDTYKIQQPYDLKVSDRFMETNGEYICWVNRSDKPLRAGSGTGARTEMRWSRDWTNGEHMWEGDVFVEPGTDHTCVMQIKSNNGGREAIYLQVQNNNLYNDNNLKNVLLPDCTGKWFHVVSAYNPATDIGRVWINGGLKLTTNYKTAPGTIWYFKNGVYNTSKFSKSHFKNIRFWSE